MRGDTTMFTFLIRYAIKWVIQGWILAKLAKFIRRWLVKKYAVEKNFKQTHFGKHVDWRNLRWFAELAAYAYKRDNYEIEKRYNTHRLYINTINEIKYIVLFDDACYCYRRR